jgi:tetratricopeptide (TPR) repeat protein
MSIKRSCLAIVLFLTAVASSFPQTQNDRAFAVKLYNQGMFEEAARVLEAVMDQDRADPFDQALLGLCYLRLDRLEEAERLLEQARRRDPKLSIVHLGLAQLAFQRRRFEEAYRAFSKAEELDPQSRDAREGRSASLINRGAELYGEGQEAAAEEKFRRALDLDPSSVPALRNLALLELERGNTEGAATHLEKARSLAPGDAKIQILLVQLREQQGDSAALLRELQRLVQLQPRNPDAWAKLGILYEQRGNTAQAEAAFVEAEQWGSSEPYPYYFLAKSRGSVSLAHLAAGKAVQKAGLLRFQAAQHIQKREGDLQEEDLERLKDLSERISEPLRILEDTLLLLQELRGTPEAFREDLLLLNDWYPHSVELQEALAAFYQKQGNWVEALAVWEQVLGAHPSSVKALAGRGNALEQLGRPEEALPAYHRALDQDPRSGERYEDLFRIYYGLERQQELLVFLREQILRDPRNPLLFGKLADLEESLGYTEEAAAHRRRQAELEAAASSSRRRPNGY